MNDTTFATAIAALDKAKQLVDIATDWNLDEVEIDGEMVDTYSLTEVFEAAIADLTAPVATGVAQEWQPITGHIILCMSGEIQDVQAHSIGGLPLPTDVAVCKRVDAPQAAQVAYLEQQLEQAATYRGIEGYPCPLCKYDNGVFVARCQMHTDMDEMMVEINRLRKLLGLSPAYALTEDDLEPMNRAMSAAPQTGLDGMPDDVREALAEYAHAAWSGWMKYLFEKGHIHDTGICVLPHWAVERWTRQMNTPYADLSEEEKKSDREEADRMLAVCKRAQGAPDAPQAKEVGDEG